MIVQIWRFFPYLFSQFGSKGCQQSAAALTYMTLFAIVPMMTVTYSMFSMIPAFQGLGEQLQALMFTHLVPATGQEIGAYLKGFSDQARSLTVWGVGMLVITAYLMLKNIERVFNTIWSVREPRKGLSNFLLYWAILSLGPILLGSGLAMTTYLLSLRLMVAEFDAIGIVPAILQVMPWVLTSCAFTLLFAAVPNCRVPLRHALVGGVATALVFELLKTLFAIIVARSDMQVIYGAFAAVPLFLMWVYILWMVVLGGAILVRAMSIYRIESHSKPCPDLVAALLALWTLHVGHKTGVGVSDNSLLQLGLGDEQWQHLCRRLQKARIITRTLNGELVLSRDLYHLSLHELTVVVGVDHQLSSASRLLDLPWYSTLAGRLQAIDEQMQQQLSVMLGHLFDQDGASSASTRPHLDPLVSTDTSSESINCANIQSDDENNPHRSSL